MIYPKKDISNNDIFKQKIYPKKDILSCLLDVFFPPWVKYGALRRIFIFYIFEPQRWQRH